MTLPIDSKAFFLDKSNFQTYIREVVKHASFILNFMPKVSIVIIPFAATHVQLYIIQRGPLVAGAYDEKPRKKCSK